MTEIDPQAIRNPFPGLRSFRPDEADVFFGRERQIDELRRRLDEVPLVTVAGASGCGKSSLVLAGLLKALQQRHVEGHPLQWRPVVMRPGSEPILNLARPLAAALSPDGDPSRAAALAGRLRLGGTALAEAVRLARLPSSVRILVVVDQFEELFRYRRISDPEECGAFVKLLLEAAADASAPVSVILTMRSDAMGFCADFRDLPEAVSRGQFLVPRMTREQRKEAITGPVTQLGFSIAPRLVQRVLNDVTDDFDDLPVMQHVLTRTWARWAAQTHGARAIDLEDYEAVGTSRHAISQHADEALQDLRGLEPVAERVFRALTERIGGPGSEVRRPMRFGELCAVSGAEPAEVQAVAARYRRADTVFLMPPEGEIGYDTPVDISHESLVRGWERLRAWADAEAESARAYRRIADAAGLHAQHEEGLLVDPALQIALQWREREHPNASWARLYADGFEQAMAFLDASEREREAQRAAARRERHLRRWLRAAAVLGGLAVIGVLGWPLYLNQRLAQQQHDEQQRDKSRRLAAAADAALKDKRKADALLLATAAVKIRPATEEAQESLRNALRQASETAGAQRRGKFASQKQWLGTYAVAFDPSGAQLAIASDDGQAWLWNTEAGAADGAVLAGTQGGLTSVLYAPGGRLVAATDEGRIAVWDLASRKLLAQWMEDVSDDRVSSIALTPDGTTLASGARGGRVKLWRLQRCVVADAAQCEPLLRLMLPHEGDDEVHSLAFSDDGALLAIARQDGRLLVWNMRTGRLVDTPIVTGKALKKVAFRPRSHQLAVGGLGGSVRLWDVDKPATPSELPHPVGVTALAFDATGKRLVTGSNDGSLRLWDVDGQQLVGHPFVAHDRPVFSVAFHPASAIVASAGNDEEIAFSEVDFEAWPARACRLASASLETLRWPAALTLTDDERRVCTAIEVAANEGNPR